MYVALTKSHENEWNIYANDIFGAQQTYTYIIFNPSVRLLESTHVTYISHPSFSDFFLHSPCYH